MVSGQYWEVVVVIFFRGVGSADLSLSLIPGNWPGFLPPYHFHFLLRKGVLDQSWTILLSFPASLEPLQKALVLNGITIYAALGP